MKTKQGTTISIAFQPIDTNWAVGMIQAYPQQISFLGGNQGDFGRIIRTVLLIEPRLEPSPLEVKNNQTGGVYLRVSTHSGCTGSGSPYPALCRRFVARVLEFLKPPCLVDP
jgi:hypothetical protein